MTHITREQAWVFACNFLPTEAAQALGPAEAQVICNAAIEHYIAQQAASVDATFKKWNTPILDEYAPMQHEPENEPAVSLASQAAPKAQLDEAWKAGFRRGAWGQTVDEKLVEALEKLARLGNGEHYGNSDGNMIARAALDLYKKDQKTNTSQERVQKSSESVQMPLTEPEITAIYHSVYFNGATGRAVDFARAIEAAHGIGGTKV